MSRLLNAAAFSKYLGCVAQSFPAILRERRLEPADSAFARICPVASLQVCGVTIKCPSELLSGARELYGRQVYFTQRGIQRGSMVLDLGCNVGLFTVLAAKLGAQVIAVEAQTGFQPYLERNLQLNGCSAEVHWGMVGSGGVLADPSKTHTSLKEQPVRLNLETILRGRQIDFLKCDIEGSEFALFQGSWLDQVQSIAMEVHTEFGDARKLTNHLDACGFRTTLTTSTLRPTRRLQKPTGYIFATRQAAPLALANRWRT